MIEPTHRTNAQWLQALRAEGAEAARAQSELRELVLRGLARGLAGRSEAGGELEDFAHEALLRILGSLDSFRGESRFATWAIAIAMRVAFSSLRRRRWREVPFEQLPDAPPPAQPQATKPNPERALARSEVLAELARTMRHGLTSRQRAVIFAELRGMPQAEIAARLGMNRNALYKLGHDARRALLRALEAAGFDRDNVRAAFEEP
jgi:RNA polymerase sigma-70 factor, ECF subfamily